MPLPTRPLSDLLPIVVPYAPGCSTYLAQQCLRLAAVTFCEKTRLWREIDTITITGQDEPLTTSAYSAIHEIESAEWEDGTVLEPVRFAAFNSADLSETLPAAPNYITQSSANTLSVVPFQTGDVRVTLILKPLAGPEFGVSGATTQQDIQNVIPAFMHEQYGHQIADGALDLILMTPKTEFYDPKRAALHRARFQDACVTSFNRHMRGQQRARARVRANWI